MTLRSLPFVPTLIVLLAVAVMIALGIWQLGRADEKQALLRSYESVSTDGEAIAYPQGAEELARNLYRKVAATCESVSSIRGKAGTNRVGVKGWSHVATCTLAIGGEADVALGWSRSPDLVEWSGGDVRGILGPGGRIVADPPLADLGPLAAPDPVNLPNNHLSYAVQWFLFALTALVIYFLALRARARKA